jgi:uncharacterized protein (DUF2249 family)/quercetin dioxygenase-like cupin family protein
MATPELDVRALRKPDKHPAVFKAYDALAAGESFVLVNNHDPRHLREEFEAEHPGSYAWDYLDRGPAAWRIRISKLTAAALPRVLCDATRAAIENDPDAAGAVWSLPMRRRDLDANIIRLRPEAGIDSHTGPDLDVLILGLAGAGRVLTETDPLELGPGTLMWLPRGSRRGFTAGPEGLSYLTMHQRRQALVLEPPPTAAGR